MALKLVLAVTDRDWFEYLRQHRPVLDEVNFWSPSPGAFRALGSGEVFLFKLKRSRFIVGGGVFAHAHNELSVANAWQLYGHGNGAGSKQGLRAMLGPAHGGSIGCRVLTQAVFLPQEHWLEVPESFKDSIIRFKTYSLEDADGLRMWRWFRAHLDLREAQLGVQQPADAPAYGPPAIILPRLGQAGFRSAVLQAYAMRCAVSGERSLPTLDAAHIRPYNDFQNHSVQNGVLLRTDIHRLFDSGYVTITPDYEFRVSEQLRDDYQNGRAYYRLAGTRIALPQDVHLHPDRSALEWHSENRYLG